MSLKFRLSLLFGWNQWLDFYLEVHFIIGHFLFLPTPLDSPFHLLGGSTSLRSSPVQSYEFNHFIQTVQSQKFTSSVSEVHQFSLTSSITSFRQFSHFSHRVQTYLEFSLGISTVQCSLFNSSNSYLVYVNTVYDLILVILIGVVNSYNQCNHIGDYLTLHTLLSYYGDYILVHIYIYIYNLLSLSNKH